MAKAKLTQTQREALAEIIGSISDAPHGDVLGGRAFEMLRGPVYRLIMDVVGGDDEEIAESIQELQQVRSSVRTIGTG